MVCRLGPLKLVEVVVPAWLAETLTVVMVNKGCEVLAGETVLSTGLSKFLLSVCRVDVGLDITSSEGTVTTFSVETCSRGTLDCERGIWCTDSVETDRVGTREVFSFSVASLIARKDTDKFLLVP